MGAGAYWPHGARRAPEHRGRIITSSKKSIKPMWKQWINALLGAATIAVPFLGLTGATLAWTLVIMGAVVLALSLWTAGEVTREEYEQAVAEHRHSHA